MAVKLVFLGRLEDTAGCAERVVAASGELDHVLAELEPALVEQIACERIRMAVNGVLLASREGLVLADGDELAFLPPVSGG